MLVQIEGVEVETVDLVRGMEGVGATGPLQ